MLFRSLPIPLLDKLVDFATNFDTQMKNVAIGIDGRSEFIKKAVLQSQELQNGALVRARPCSPLRSFSLIRKTKLWRTNKPPALRNIINLRLDITHLYYPAKNSFQKSRLKRREIFTELLLYTLTT